MKLENGHHVKIGCITDEQYHKFCKKAEDQGFSIGTGILDNYRDWVLVGIYEDEVQVLDDFYKINYPSKLLTIEQALSEEEETMEQKCRIIEIDQPPQFKPFKIELIIDSENDLKNLWNIMYTGSFRAKNESNIDESLWELLDNKMTELDLKV